MHAPRDEIMRILRPGMRKDGAISPADRTYLVKLVSARTGLSQTDAEQRADPVSKFGNVLQPIVPPRLILALAVAGG